MKADILWMLLAGINLMLILTFAGDFVHAILKRRNPKKDAQYCLLDHDELRNSGDNECPSCGETL